MRFGKRYRALEVDGGDLKVPSTCVRMDGEGKEVLSGRGKK